MNIYTAEKEAGLEGLLSAKSSIVYASLVEKSAQNYSAKEKIRDIKAFAGVEDSDLYYTQSILVTTSWNKNDDIFDPVEVWKARSTPAHKPTNLEHDEASIVGHIVSNWPIDEDGHLIEDGTDPDNLPKKFHILTSSVIYTGYTEAELRERSQKLIEDIESGTKYVSMECFFKNFDYGLVNSATGSYHILPRNEETAFLTQHLRAYGGSGQHQDYKIGRVLRNITFSGKGFVNKPANPESVIFTRENLRMQKEQANEKNDDFAKEGVFSNQANLKENIMNIEPETVEQVSETVAETVVETQSDVSVDDAPVAEAPAEEAVVVDTPVENTLSEDTEAAKKMDEEKEDMRKKMQTMKAALDEALAQLASSNEALAAYKNKEQEMMKKEQKNKRMAMLIKNGVAEDAAMAAVEKFELLDDETFDNIHSLLSVAKSDNVKTEETKASEDISLALENVETQPALDLSTSSDVDSELNNTRAALVDFVCIRLGKKLNKGE